MKTLLLILTLLPVQDEKAELKSDREWIVSEDTGEAGDTGWHRRPDDAFVLAGPYHNVWADQGDLLYTIREVKGRNILWTIDPKTKKVVLRTELPEKYAIVLFSTSFLKKGKFLLGGLKDCRLYDIETHKSVPVDTTLLYRRGESATLTNHTDFDGEWFTALVDDVSKPECSAALVRFRYDDPEKVTTIPLPRSLEGADRHEHNYHLLGVQGDVALLRRSYARKDGLVDATLLSVDLSAKKVLSRKQVKHYELPLPLGGEASGFRKGRFLVAYKDRAALMDPKTFETEDLPIKLAFQAPPQWVYVLDKTAVIVATDGEYVLFDPVTLRELGKGIFIENIVGGLNSIGKKDDRLWVFQCDYGKRPYSSALLKTKKIKDHYLRFRMERKATGDK